MLSTKHFKIVFNVNIGNINEKKANSLSNVFDAAFEVKMLQEQPFGNVFVLSNPTNREALIIDPGKITYQLESEENISPNFESINKFFQNIFDTLLLEENATGLIHLIGTVPSKNENSMSDSLTNFLPSQNFETHINNLKGIGLRFLIEHHTGVWEYKVEPQINDTRFFFIEMINNINKNIHFSETINIAQEYFNDFNDRKLNVLNQLNIL